VERVDPQRVRDRAWTRARLRQARGHEQIEMTSDDARRQSNERREILDRPAMLRDEPDDP